eukprot:CAMPEP_0203808950 /NCGR_PEP_ID=MMETSP0115-20131106/1932_1 /ASSEMBLY_ACC=CAM_ASM_000227 /TAXON_ID=33651 /ORGANISM="Bicosoecid sp, Strain ms1" /LENGTH=58 /DNA_ID=CAMNT_0050717657 /DNA_START=10 /DNA_END=183 /DNA_ORIENTATION=+
MMKHHPATVADVADAGGVAALLDVVRGGNANGRANASGALAELMKQHAASAAAVADGG